MELYLSSNSPPQVEGPFSWLRPGHLQYFLSNQSIQQRSQLDMNLGGYETILKSSQLHENSEVVLRVG